jgi:hypothetical protein
MGGWKFLHTGNIKPDYYDILSYSNLNQSFIPGFPAKLNYPVSKQTGSHLNSASTPIANSVSPI